MNKELVLKIDKLIELGYEYFLEEDLNILNSNNIKRLEVLRVMNYDLESKEELFNILNTDKFYIEDTKLDLYIPNIIPYKEHIELETDFSLDSFRNTSRTYSFNGILISIPKVNRLKNQGINIYDALIYNVNMSDEVYELFSNALVVKQEKKN